MANIKNELNNIKSALYGKDVRGSIHDVIDAINKEVENTTSRQVDLENTFDQLVINAGNSNAEIVDARVKSDGTSYSKLGDRLNEVDSQLAQNMNKIETLVNREILLSEVGCTSNEDDASNNTAIIQDLIDKGISFKIDIRVPINDTITINTSFNDRSIIGKNKSIIMLKNNLPIFKFDTVLTYNCRFENFNISYKNYQNLNCENSIAICFESNENKSWGWFDLTFKNMTISKAYISIGNVTSEPIWDCVFDNILIQDVYKHAISLNRSGQLGNQFRNIKIRNYSIRDTSNANNGSTCIIIKGEFSFYNLTVEDWNGTVFLSDDCSGVIENMHIERLRLLNDDYYRIFSHNGYLYIKNCTMTFSKINIPSKFARVFEVNNSSCLTVDGFLYEYNSDVVKGVIFLVNGYKNSKIFTYNIRGMDVINTDYNPDIKSNRVSIINGVPIVNFVKYNNKPINIEFKKGDIAYKNNLTVGEGIGWVAIANSKNTNKLNFTVSTNYNTVVNTNIDNVQDFLSIGDGVVIGETDKIYTVKSLTNNSFVVSPQPNQNFQNSTIRNATSSEVLKEFGVII